LLFLEAASKIIAMMDGLLEPDIIPEAAPKKQRGRPRVISVEEMRRNRREFPDLKSDRQHQNRTYAYWAMGELGLLGQQPSAEFAWLCDPLTIAAGTSNTIKWSLLTELGRLVAAGVSNDVVSTIATQLCEQRPTVKNGAAMIRRFRLGKPAAGSGRVLLTRLLGCFDAWRTEYPDTAPRELGAAAEAFVAIVRSVIQDEG
jgi:hypothetical protein